MQLPTQVPPGSVIQVADDGDGVTYSWTPPQAGWARFFPGGFLVIWLVGWAFGLVFAITELIRGQGNQGFLVFWLTGWTIGGLFAGTMAYYFLRPPRPESLRLDRYGLTHVPGGIPPQVLFSPFAMMENPRAMYDPFYPFAMLLRSRKAITIEKHDVGPVRLERVGERQRLSFDRDSDRIEIGRFLREPEREWLAQVIEDWKSS